MQEKKGNLMKTKLGIMFAALLVTLSSYAGITAYSDDGTGARFNLLDDVCTQFDNADGIATFTSTNSPVTFEGCWKYDKENNIILIVIEGRIFELPASLFTSV